MGFIEQSSASVFEFENESKADHDPLFLVRNVFDQITDKIENMVPVEIMIAKRGGPLGINASASKDVIYLSPLYALMLANDVPFTSINDPNFEDIDQLQSFSDDICRRFDFVPKKVDYKDRVCVGLFLKLMEDPEKAKNALKFNLLHELGHIQHNHFDKIQRMKKQINSVGSHTIDFFSLGAFSVFYSSYTHKALEKEADEFACLYGGQEAREGGAYLFNTIRKYRFKDARERVVHASLIAKSAINHPSLASRSKKIRKYNSEL